MAPNPCILQQVFWDSSGEESHMSAGPTGEVVTKTIRGGAARGEFGLHESKWAKQGPAGERGFLP